MKYLKLLNIIQIIFIVFALLALPAMADWHGMSGNLDTDWGVKLQQAYADDASNSNAHQNSYSQNWIPSSKTADFVIDNNIDPSYIRTSPQFYPSDWTKYCSTGTHIRKTGLDTTYAPFVEDMLGSYYQPAGGEPFDIEALYFDDDSNNMYLAIVTSMNQSGYSENSAYESSAHRFTEAGDIAIDLDRQTTNGLEYEYGIVTHPANNPLLGHLIYKPVWSLPQSSDGFAQNAPSKCAIGTGSVDLGSVPMLYTKTNIKETVNYGIKGTRDVYKNIIEVSIPRSKIGNPSIDKLSNIHITVGCGNDVIELEPVRFKSNIPEFPSIALPVASIIGLMFILGRRKKE